jgi:signal transduction histidine kinase
VRLSVSDTGIGISPDFLPHVFDRFRQAETGSARKFGGLGLGLTIVRHVVEAHGGSVEAYSAGVGAGSCFSVTLPTQSSASADDPNPNQEEPALEVGPSRDVRTRNEVAP